MYSERLENRATVKAGELVKAGAIGKVIQTIGLGPAPHDAADAARPGSSTSRATAASSATSPRTRPISSSTSPARRSAEVVAVAGRQRPPPAVSRASRTSATSMLRGDGGTGYIRVDWFTPDGLADLGRRPADDARHRRASSRSARTSTSAAGRAAATCSWSTRRRRATSTARTSRCPTASSSSTTWSTGPRRRCRRRTASWPPS